MNRAINLTLWVIILFMLGGLIAREYAIYQKNTKICEPCPACPPHKPCDPCEPCPTYDGPKFDAAIGKHDVNIRQLEPDFAEESQQ